MTEEQPRKPDGATHLENEKPDENEIEAAYEPPLRDKEKAKQDDLEEEV